VLKSSYTAREADDIANLAFIGGKTNRQISDKSPSQYFPGLVKKGGLPRSRLSAFLRTPRSSASRNIKVSFWSAED